MYIPKSEFGWNRRTGWLHGDEASYNNAVALMKTVQPGRQRIRPIHPSWNEVLKHFDSNDSTRSQGAFCRWAGINRATFSSWQLQEVKKWVPDYVAIWLSEQEKEVESE